MLTSELLNREKLHSNFYRESIREYSPYDVRALHWNSRQSQQGRFISLKRIGNLNNKNILDIGCGTGDFLTFLKEHNIKPAHYFGIDLMNEFIEVSKERHPEAEFIIGDFFEYHFPFDIDYAFCNGALNVRETNNMKLLEKAIKKVLDLVKCGFGLTLIKFCREYVEDNKLFYYKEKNIEQLLKKLRVIYKIHSDYADNDFSVFIYKKIITS